MSFQLLGPSPMSSRTIRATRRPDNSDSLYTFGLRLFFFFSMKKKKFQTTTRWEREKIKSINESRWKSSSFNTDPGWWRLYCIILSPTFKCDWRCIRNQKEGNRLNRKSYTENPNSQWSELKWYGETLRNGELLAELAAAAEMGNRFMNAGLNLQISAACETAPIQLEMVWAALLYNKT